MTLDALAALYQTVGVVVLTLIGAANGILTLLALRDIRKHVRTIGAAPSSGIRSTCASKVIRQ